MLRAAVLISGNGTNLQALMDAVESGKLPIKICVVASNKADAYGLKRAKLANIPTFTLTHQGFLHREAYDMALLQCLERYQPDCIILAGFMRILGEQFIQRFQHRIFNIHPSLLPKYPGLHTHEKALAAKDTHHGVTVHMVTKELDAGAIIAQADVAIESDDTPVTLQQKIHALEHRLYPEVIRLYALNQLKIQDDGVFLNGKKLPVTGVKLFE